MKKLMYLLIIVINLLLNINLSAQESMLIGEIQINAYKDAMNKLDPKDAIFIRMLVIENKSTSEVMAFFGWNSENSVYSRKNKVIAKLRSLSKKAIQKKGLV